MLREVTAKSMLRKGKRIDSWFLSRMGVNLYRGCAHNCVYCDGRSEQYRVEGDFGSDIRVKTNSVELLTRELDPKRKRKPFPGGFVMLGGGVCDAYQPVEKSYGFARKTLELILKYGHPVHILTKSTLVERDLDLISEINTSKRAVLSISFSTLDPVIASKFEPGVPPPEERFKTLSRFKKRGISVGMYLLPVLPFISDHPESLDRILQRAKTADIDFVIFGGLTLKEGQQKSYFMNALNEFSPDKVYEYNMIYGKNSKWGEPLHAYSESLNELICRLAKRYRIPVRMPLPIYSDIVDLKEKIGVILEHLDYLKRLRGERSPFGYAAYSLSKYPDTIDLNAMPDLKKIKGIGPAVSKVISEIVRTGSSKALDELIR